MSVGIRVALGVWYVWVCLGGVDTCMSTCMYEQEHTHLNALLFSRIHPAGSHMGRPTAAPAAAALYCSECHDRQPCQE